MKRQNEVFLIKQAAIDRCIDLREKGIQASWFRNKSKQYVVFFWEA